MLACRGLNANALPGEVTTKMDQIAPIGIQGIGASAALSCSIFSSESFIEPPVVLAVVL